MCRPFHVSSSQTLGKNWIIASGLALCVTSCYSNPPTSLSSSQAPVTLTIGFPYASGEDQSRGIGQATRLASLEGLTTQNSNGRPVPRLAESWTESADGLTCTIRLRPSALFHDGTAVDSSAVKASLERFLGSTASGSSPGLQDISSIEAADKFVLTIHLKQRSTLLLDDLDTPITKLDAKGSLIGTGPYVIASTSANEVVMTAFPQYYRGPSAVDRLVWRVYPTVRTAWAATMRGEADFLYDVGPETLEFLQSESSVALYPFLRAYVFGVVFNAKRPVFKDPELRRALNYAVNRASIVKQAFRSHAVAASTPAWPLHWAYDASIPGYAFDPERATASLERALKGKSGANAPRLAFVCLIPENFQLWERLALMVQRNLAEIGVDMALESMPLPQFNQRIAEGNFDAVLMEMVSGTSVSRPFFFWRSSGLANFSGYNNPSLDTALEDIRRADGDDHYREAFHRFQQAALDNPPAIFLAWGEITRAVSRRFDVVKAPGGDIRMTISDWRLAATPARAVI